MALKDGMAESKRKKKPQIKFQKLNEPLQVFLEMSGIEPETF